MKQLLTVLFAVLVSASLLAQDTGGDKNHAAPAVVKPAPQGPDGSWKATGQASGKRQYKTAHKGHDHSRFTTMGHKGGKKVGAQPTVVKPAGSSLNPQPLPPGRHPMVTTHKVGKKGKKGSVTTDQVDPPKKPADAVGGSSKPQ